MTSTAEPLAVCVTCVVPTLPCELAHEISRTVANAAASAAAARVQRVLIGTSLSLERRLLARVVVLERLHQSEQHLSGCLEHRLGVRFIDDVDVATQVVDELLHFRAKFGGMDFG